MSAPACPQARPAVHPLDVAGHGPLQADAERRRLADLLPDGKFHSAPLSLLVTSLSLSFSLSQPADIRISATCPCQCPYIYPRPCVRVRAAPGVPAGDPQGEGGDQRLPRWEDAHGDRRLDQPQRAPFSAPARTPAPLTLTAHLLARVPRMRVHRRGSGTSCAFTARFKSPSLRASPPELLTASATRTRARRHSPRITCIRIPCPREGVRLRTSSACVKPIHLCASFEPTPLHLCAAVRVNSVRGGSRRLRHQRRGRPGEERQGESGRSYPALTRRCRRRAPPSASSVRRRSAAFHLISAISSHVSAPCMPVCLCILLSLPGRSAH